MLSSVVEMVVYVCSGINPSPTLQTLQRHAKTLMGLETGPLIDVILNSELNHVVMCQKWIRPKSSQV